jgi:hypothetical protein
MRFPDCPEAFEFSFCQEKESSNAVKYFSGKKDAVKILVRKVFIEEVKRIPEIKECLKRLVVGENSSSYMINN